MKMFRDAKKIFVVLVITSAIINSILPVSAIEVTQGDVLNKVNGNYGANLSNVTGARVDTDLTKATITNTQTNSVLNWNSLNTAKGQELNFVMKDGQTSLNKVTGTGLSTFAGGINSEHGRVIISNPNGMLFENGSYINANSIILTTHYAEIDNKNRLNLTSAAKNSTIKFSGGNSVATEKIRLNIANDLNIISNNIDMGNAEVVAKDTRLITTDGVTFFAVEKVESNYKTFIIATDGNSNIGDININNSVISVRDNDTGKILILSKGDVVSENVVANGLVDVNSKKSVNFNKSQFKSIKAAAADIDINDTNIIDSNMNSSNNIKVNSSNKSNYSIKNSYLNSGNNIDISNVSIEKSNIDATSDISAKNIGILDTNFNSGSNIYIETETINGGNFEAKGTFQAKSSNWKNSLTLDNVVVTAGSGIKLMSTPNVLNSKLITTNENSNVDIQKSIISNTTINSYTIYGQNSTISDSNFDVKNDIIVSNSNVSNTTLNAIKDLKLENTTLDNVVANGRYAMLNNATLKNGTKVTIDTLTTEGTNDYNTGEIVYKPSLPVQNLTISDSTLNVNKSDVNLKDAVLTNAIINTSLGKDVKIDTVHDITLVGSNIGGNLTILNAKNVVISNSNDAGNQYIPDMTTKSQITDYDRTKYDETYFTDISEKYGDLFGNGMKLTNVSGNVSISNVENSTIVNTVVGGDLMIENISGEANLVTSLVEGNYSPNRDSIDNVNVYKSYINGNYNSKFDYQLADNDKSVVNYSAVDDVNKRKYGVDVNTKFQRRFIPRGFAADDDEINIMKNETKSSIVKTDNNFKFTKSFHAY